MEVIFDEYFPKELLTKLYEANIREYEQKKNKKSIKLKFGSVDFMWLHSKLMTNERFSANMRAVPSGSKYPDDPPGRTAREYLHELSR
jgi:hypothetical protein